MLTFMHKITHLHKYILQTLQPTASELQLQKEFHRERACLALPTSTCASGPYTGSCIHAGSGVKALNQMKIKSVLSQGYLLRLPAQVVLAAGAYKRRTWEWAA